MSGYDGLGSFSFTYNWVNDAQNGVPITASRMDGQFQDAVNGFDLVICRDGQSTTTAIIPFAVGLSTNAGIKFPATAVPSSNPNTLDDYEEGTWTPVDASGASLSFTVFSATYVKIGSAVLCEATFSYPVNASGANAVFGGLPFQWVNRTGVGGICIAYSGVGATGLLPSPGTTSVTVVNSTSGNNFTNANLSNATIRTQFTLFTV